MPEPELTAENVGDLLGRSKRQNEGEPAPSAATNPTEPETRPDQLTADQLELATRYGLTASEVRRVRGRDWPEKCADAERLAAVVQQQPNRGELAALAAHKADRHRHLVDMFHPPEKGEDS